MRDIFLNRNHDHHFPNFYVHTNLKSNEISN